MRLTTQSPRFRVRGSGVEGGQKSSKEFKRGSRGGMHVPPLRGEASPSRVFLCRPLPFTLSPFALPQRKTRATAARVNVELAKTDVGTARACVRRGQRAGNRTRASSARKWRFFCWTHNPIRKKSRLPLSLGPKNWKKEILHLGLQKFEECDASAGLSFRLWRRNNKPKRVKKRNLHPRPLHPVRAPLQAASRSFSLVHRRARTAARSERT